MFDKLSERLLTTINNIKGTGQLTEDNIADSMRSIRRALLEADVALPVVRDFIMKVSQRAIGQEVKSALTPQQTVIKIIEEELVALMSIGDKTLNLNTSPPAVIMMVGLQGAGKTTTTAKLAKLLREKDKKNILLASCDIYRPVAIQQLQILAQEIGVECYATDPQANPIDIATHALAYARKKHFDILLIDTAGRLHIDQDMMQEIKQLQKVLNPSELLFVIDSMMGQDAVNMAQAFDEHLSLTGTIVTKLDGDARGGAILSVCYITGKPIKYIGTGEKLSEFSVFHPDRIASRILGMGDVLSLIEQVEEKTEREKAEQLEKKLRKGQGLSIQDFRHQLQQMHNIGGMANIMDKLPTMAGLPANIDTQMGDKQMIKLSAIIDSMTEHERRLPEVINGSRKKRIAMGSGTQIQDVNRLLKQFKQMQKMMKKMSGKGGLKKMMRGLKGNSVFPSH